MNKEKLFKKFTKLKTYKHLAFLKDYACMDSDKLKELDGSLYHQIVKPSQNSKLKIAIEYAKVNFCKYLQGFEYRPYPFTYSKCIEMDVNGLYHLLSKEEQEIIEENYSRLKLYEKTFDENYLENNLFVEG